MIQSGDRIIASIDSYYIVIYGDMVPTTKYEYSYYFYC